MKIPRWQAALTAAERRHLRETRGGTIAALKRNREKQRPNERDYGPSYGCLECRTIAKKLGLE